MGSSLRHLGKEYGKAALTALSESARLAPGSPQVLLVLGKTEREQGDLVNAEKHLLAAKKLSNVPNADIHAELSQLYANDLKKYREAANELEEYVKASKMSDADAQLTRKKIADLRAKAQTSN
jgi:predicted Zn-dependent protease